MRRRLTADVEQYRIVKGEWATMAATGPQGLFLVRLRLNAECKVIASDGRDWQAGGLPMPLWEHVSVSMETRCPTWLEMQEVKEMFWQPNEVVVQYHVDTEDRVNLHRYCLHLWRCPAHDFPRPPKECV